MNSKAVNLLLGICLLLICILIAEWLLINSSATSSIELLVTEKVQDAAIDLPELMLEQQPIEAYSAMVDSPLFIEGRKPVSQEEGNKVDEGVSKIDDLVLVGVFSAKEQMVALFSKQGARKKYSKKIEGDDIAGWQVKEIKQDRVVLQRSGRQQTVMLRKSKQKSTIKPKPVAGKQIKLKP
ncbi:MAG: hypothetical protein KAT04_15835 [Methylococcales bacterium]|nr:hypothetical protein [Methylococcales bacterium]